MHAPATRSTGMPLPARWTLIGAAVLGGIGALVGVIVGLFAYPPTAVFAGLELDLPAALVGAVLGVAAAGIAASARRVRGPRPRAS